VTAETADPRPISAATREKAKRLLAAGAVTPLNDEEFDIVGDHDTYMVWLPRRDIRLRGMCSCPAWGPCSHVEAVKLWIAARTGGEIA
jgi:uncharacterized Zn finger protein